MADPQTRLREVLEQAAPASPDVDGLADGARRYAARVRRLRRASVGSVAALVLVVAGSMAVSTARDRALMPADPRPTPSPSPSLPFQYCQSPAPPAALAQSDRQPVSQRYRALLVCARTDQDSVWRGSLPPDDVLTAPEALDRVHIAPRDDGAGCPDLPTGPAFRLLVQGRDGTVEYLPNEALRCDGWETLSTYYVAVAEQRGDPGDDRLDGSYLACPPVWKAPSAASPPSLPRGTVFTTATICLHPLAVLPPTEVPVLRAIRGGALGEVQLAPLNAELARHGTGKGAAATCSQKAWRYVLRAVTSDGRLVELGGSCPEQLELVGVPGTTLRLGPEAASMLRGSVLGS